MTNELEGIKQIDYKELNDLINSNSSEYVIDVREYEEYVEGHIPDIPLIPMSEIIDLIDQFEKDQPYIFVCRSGRRSQEVAKFFKMNGIENVANYEGGMLEWQDEIETGETNIIESISNLYKK
ncbi:rhodanese-like domain-containing protein [Filobacillus milosensis]|uniref:Rhodanese-like domain-containing protein n=1 Tax=Filobacillus milosensis TaxID=94137 RepID=A0A4Y8IXJ1_9BACI|nr:rhodanese-like domain-containing protein [Filobacillus milosensis]TFB24105.1 rhodanese-like domain-containing protein [Filobacillus milosensis]